MPNLPNLGGAEPCWPKEGSVEGERGRTSLHPDHSPAPTLVKGHAKARKNVTPLNNNEATQ